jgi:hypothetical protein
MRLLSSIVSERVYLIDLLTLVITNRRQLDGWEQLSQSLSYAVENRIGVWARQGHIVIATSHFALGYWSGTTPSQASSI